MTHSLSPTLITDVESIILHRLLPDRKISFLDTKSDFILIEIMAQGGLSRVDGRTKSHLNRNWLHGESLAIYKEIPLTTRYGTYTMENNSHGEP